MKKNELLNVLGTRKGVKEHHMKDALDIQFETAAFEIHITIPYHVTELFYYLLNHEGELILEDWHDFYGETEKSDFRDAINAIAVLLEDPQFRLINEDKTVEIMTQDNEWVYFFGDYHHEN